MAEGRPSQLNELTSLGGTDVIVGEDVGIPDVGFITLTNFVASIDDLNWTFTGTLDFASATVNNLTAADVNAAPDTHVGSGGTAHADATTTTDGFMTSGDKSKLDGIEAGAQVNPADTDGLSEGSTNLYHTAARASTAAPVQSVAGKTGTITISLGDLTDGDNYNNNVILGTNPASISNADSCVILGRDAAQAITNGDDNVIVGHRAGFSLTGGRENVFIGFEAGENDENGERNVAIGWQAYATNTGVTGGHNNTVVGGFAGWDIDGGDYNTLIGWSAGYNITTGSNNTVIGLNAVASSSSVSDEITLGSNSVTRFRIPGLGIDWTDDPLKDVPWTLDDRSTVSTNQTLNLSAGNYFKAEPTADLTFDFTNVADGTTGLRGALILLTGAGDHTISWTVGGGGTVNWVGGSAPTFATGTDRDLVAVTPISSTEVLLSLVQGEF